MNQTPSLDFGKVIANSNLSFPSKRSRFFSFDEKGKNRWDICPSIAERVGKPRLFLLLKNFRKISESCFFIWRIGSYPFLNSMKNDAVYNSAAPYGV